LCIVIQLWK